MTAIKNEASSFAMFALGVIADIADPRCGVRPWDRTG